MIVKMAKYSFLVYHSDYVGFLETLQKSGVVHVIEKENKTQEDEEIVQKGKLLQQLKETVAYLKSKKVEQSLVDNAYEATEIIDQVKYYRLLLEVLKVDLQTAQKEIALLRPWGKFSWETIDNLKKAGKYLHFFTCSSTTFDAKLENEFHLFTISNNGKQTYFVIVSDSPIAPEIKANLQYLPTKSLKELQKTEAKLKAEIDVAEAKINKLAASGIEKLEEYASVVKTEKQFKTVQLQSTDEADAKLKLLEGWVPVNGEEKLVAELEKESVYFVKRDPTDEDNVPVLLKNNSFARLFEVVGSLYSLPSYREFDLTPLFAPFFMLFFGFCLGDAGYGLFLLVVATVLKLRDKKSKMRPIFTLVQWLSLSTIVMGFISGTFFGIPLLEVEGLAIKKYMLDSNQLFNLSLILGLVQIIFGLCVKAYSLINFKGIKYAVSTLGWILLIVGMIVLFGLGKFLAIPETLKPVLMYSILGVAGFMILIFNDPDSNPLISSLKGVWDVYGMVSGVFGDTLSYIRLFALGTSGAILGYVINTIAMQILSIAYVGPIFFIIFLLFGHSLTIGLSILGAFVHPMRLTFVEFYKNAGFEGGGKMYKPFSIETNK
jgi:V/A-type H+-transporting ATPase subunit I